jgi:hypothetical protein
MRDEQSLVLREKMKRYEQVGGKRKWRMQPKSYERKSLII